MNRYSYFEYVYHSQPMLVKSATTLKSRSNLHDKMTSKLRSNLNAKKVLIAYATWAGSTAEIAEAIAKILREPYDGR